MSNETSPKEAEAIQEQFKRNLSHILIDTKVKGPEIDFGGGQVLRFKSKAPVQALAKLVGSDNRVTGMEDYIRGVLMPGQDDVFSAILEVIDIDGLAEILGVLGEAYTSFPEKS